MATATTGGRALKRRLLQGTLIILLGMTPQLGVAQGSIPKWEYGRLYSSHGVPLVFATGRASLAIDSSTAVYRRALMGNAKAEADSGVLLPWSLTMLTMNRLGAEGWELVAIVREPGGDESTEYYFKRPARPSSP